jgi:hypothetical protein
MIIRRKSLAAFNPFRDNLDALTVFANLKASLVGALASVERKCLIRPNGCNRTLVDICGDERRYASNRVGNIIVIISRWMIDGISAATRSPAFEIGKLRNAPLIVE